MSTVPNASHETASRRTAEPWSDAVPRGRSASIAGLHLLALVGVAVAQPIYDIVGRYASFLVAHAAQAADVAILVLVLSVLLPSTLLAAETLADLLARRASLWLHRVLMGLLFAMTAMLALRLAPLPGWLLVALSAVFGLSGATTYAQRSWLRGFISVLSLAALAFPAYFLLATPVASLLFGGSAPPREVSRDGPATPVVVVIFDEFSATSIMDRSQRIDGARYPHLAALAADATWFRNATSVATDTVYAVPAILSGRYPDRRRLATAADYPETLLTLLGGSHDLRVFESVTGLCPRQLCGSRPRLPFADRLGSVFSDLSFVYLHLLLPADLATALPSVSATWRDFGGQRPRGDGGSAFTPTHRVGGPAHFGRFLAALRSGRDSTLYLVHLLLPHWPWEFLPSGKEYGPLATPVREWAQPTPPDPGRGRGYYWGNDEWSVTQAFQRYLLQVGYVDRLIGELTSTLKAAGLYDRCLLLVVADHGVSFLPGHLRKKLTDGDAAHFAEIVNVPLLVKLPGQRQGAIDDRNVQTIDVLPTIADALGLEIPWPVDGRSAFAANPGGPHKRAINSFDASGTASPFDYETGDLAARRKALDRMLALFGSGRAGEAGGGLFGIGPYPGLLGRPVGDRVGEPAAATVELDGPPELVEHYDPDGAYAPTHVTGRVLGAVAQGGPLDLAVAVNGVVRAVTRTFEHDERGASFTAMVPESALVPGTNRIEVFVVSQAAGRPVLRPLPRSAVEDIVLAELANGGEGLMGDGETIPVVAGEVQGAVEEIVGRTASGWAMLSGWAADIAGDRAAERVLVFADGRLAATAEPYGARPDVARQFSKQGVLRCGFGVALPPSLFPSQPPYPVVRVFAISERGVASELTHSATRALAP